MGAPVVRLVESVVLRVGLLDLCCLGVHKHHVDAVASTSGCPSWDGEVALPVEAESVAAVGDGALDVGGRVAFGLGVAFDEFIEILKNGREIVFLYPSRYSVDYVDWETTSTYLCVLGHNIRTSNSPPRRLRVDLDILVKRFPGLFTIICNTGKCRDVL